MENALKRKVIGRMSAILNKKIEIKSKNKAK